MGCTRRHRPSVRGEAHRGDGPGGLSRFGPGVSVAPPGASAAVRPFRDPTGPPAHCRTPRPAGRHPVSTPRTGRRPCAHPRDRAGCHVARSQTVTSRPLAVARWRVGAEGDREGRGPRWTGEVDLRRVAGRAGHQMIAAAATAAAKPTASRISEQQLASFHHPLDVPPLSVPTDLKVTWTRTTDTILNDVTYVFGGRAFVVLNGRDYNPDQTRKPPTRNNGWLSCLILVTRSSCRASSRRASARRGRPPR